MGKTREETMSSTYWEMELLGKQEKKISKKEMLWKGRMERIWGSAFNWSAVNSSWCNTLQGHRRWRGKRDKVKEMRMGGFESSRPIFDFAAAGIFAFLAVFEHWAFLFLEMPREHRSNYFKTQENFLGSFQFALQFLLSLPSKAALIKCNRSWR